MKLYLSGPMSGYPLYNYPSFLDAAKILRDKGHTVFNPAERDLSKGFNPEIDPPKPFVEYMREDLPAVMDAEAVVVLPGWENSKGANLEVTVARECGIPIFVYSTDSSDGLFLLPAFFPCPEPESEPESVIISNSGKFVTKDSGKREEFSGGAVRDCSENKSRFDLIPPLALKRISELYDRGRVKYSAWNWSKGMPFSRFYESALRHLYQYGMGDTDEDHLSSVCFNVMSIIHLQETGRTDLDDMPPWKDQ